MSLDVELLSRLQFAFTIMFHYIFPPFSIGMGLLLVIYETMFVVTKKPIYEKITRFWIKIFAANFSVGVATGIVMEFEFGTNWATYSRFVGDIFGSPLAAEGIFAFFLESGFLAILLFGWNRVSKGMHLFSTLMVFVGSMMSAFWIVVANSWQQTPVAYRIVTDDSGYSRAVITDFWAMVFNPSSMARFEHVLVGAFIQGAFLILSVSAYYLLKKKYVEFGKTSFKIALGVATVASLLQLVTGDISAQVVRKFQPAKMAAMEGLYETRSNAPLYIMGWVDEEAEETKGIYIPGGLSFLSFGTTEGVIKGLDQVPKEDRPPVNAVFQSYHIMVALGMFFIGLNLFALFLMWRKKLFEKRWMMKIYVGAVILPVIANQLGWLTAERGRQPWLVQGLLRTSEGISKSVTGPEVLTSIILFFIVYVGLFLVWVYVLDKEIKHGPVHLEDAPAAGYSKEEHMVDPFKDL
ncbi:cytochrome ubiquinol oxidase subunit I [Fulvitalea axinellae]|uniref:Cytochrome ubiquinol oxidase subunit I n=1 Tax=Fulvitalea axinellae TaxID=1182444 RepID=A0AAU9CWE5_9BACT|nr:cytochrome ubiquinol oxidase subunit I [Fulvitalea axinellae]